MVLGDAEDVCGCKGREVCAGFVVPLLLRACQGGLEQPLVSDADIASMLEGLVSMKCLDKRALKPGGFGWQGRRLLREFTKGVLVLFRPAAVGRHRLIKSRIVRGDEDTFLGSDHEYLITYIEMQTVSQILG